MEKFIYPLADHLYAREKDDLYDCIMDSDRGHRYTREIIAKEKYLDMKGSSIGKKGAGGGAREK